MCIMYEVEVNELMNIILTVCEKSINKCEAHCYEDLISKKELREAIEDTIIEYLGAIGTLNTEAKDEDPKLS